MKKRILSLAICACMALTLTFGALGSAGTASRDVFVPQCDGPSGRVSQ